jgi:hypothetical protein
MREKVFFLTLKCLTTMAIKELYHHPSSLLCLIWSHTKLPGYQTPFVIETTPYNIFILSYKPTIKVSSNTC